ncbi:MAG: hypothetical protein HZB76_07355 [Chlamydiae bacterium]|nr:hypothetical protein [Chlamydiota bacterium]
MKPFKFFIFCFSFLTLSLFSNVKQYTLQTSGSSNWILPASAITTLFDGNSPQIAINNAGEGVAIWNSGGNIYSSYTTNNGLTWSIPHNFVAGTDFPNIVLNNAGQAIAVYNNDIQYSTDSGHTWTSAISFPVAPAQPIKIAINDNGVAIVAWEDSLNKLRICFSSDGGQNWDFSVGQIATLTSSNFNVAINNYWQAIVSYTEATIPKVFYRDKDANTATTTLGDPSVGPYGVWCSLNNNNQAVAIWIDSVTNIKTRNSTDGGLNWNLSINTLGNSNTISQPPEIAINNLGQTIAIWKDSATANTVSKYSSDGGASWSISPQAVIDSTTTHNLALNNANTAIILGYDGSQLSASSSTNGGQSWSSNTVLSTTTDENQQIAINNQGRAIAVWHDTSL